MSSATPAIGVLYVTAPSADPRAGMNAPTVGSHRGVQPLTSGDGCGSSDLPPAPDSTHSPTAPPAHISGPWGILSGHAAACHSWSSAALASHVLLPSACAPYDVAACPYRITWRIRARARGGVHPFGRGSPNAGVRHPLWRLQCQVPERTSWAQKLSGVTRRLAVGAHNCQVGGRKDPRHGTCRPGGNVPSVSCGGSDSGWRGWSPPVGAGSSQGRLRRGFAA